MISVPGSVWTATLTTLRGCGEGRRECVAYWVAPAGAIRVARVVHPLHTSTAVHYGVDDAWVNSFWLELARSAERVVAQVHTHRGRACHSWTDDEGALVYEAGFLSLVLPTFAISDGLDGAFLAELDQDGAWRALRVEEGVRWD